MRQRLPGVAAGQPVQAVFYVCSSTCKRRTIRKKKREREKETENDTICLGKEEVLYSS